jgi:catechol 2,3-dioxygenase-like lactoylglutathione lyase family enzyme
MTPPGDCHEDRSHPPRSLPLQGRQETVLWYQKYLNMDFILAIAEDQVPSTKAADPYMHVFLDAGQGNVLAFFEIPNSPPMGRDINTPAWVQHIAFKVDSEATLKEVMQRLQADGIEVVGITDHTIFKSIYFSIPAATVWSWQPIAPARSSCSALTRSSGRCWRNGRAPGAHPGTRPGCMRKEFTPAA